MARIRLEEALALGLIPPDQVAVLRERFPAVGRSQVFGSPLFVTPSRGGGALQRNLFGFGPSYGPQTARFGLGPLLLGLGLSPAPSAVTAPGAVPTRAGAARRREELSPEQLAALYAQIGRAGALPRQTIAPQLPTPSAIPAMNRLRVMGVSQDEVREIQAAAGPGGGDVTAALKVARKAIGVGKEILDDQSLLRQVVDPILAAPPALRAEAAFQAQRAGERTLPPLALAEQAVPDVGYVPGAFAPLSAPSALPFTPTSFQPVRPELPPAVGAEAAGAAAGQAGELARLGDLNAAAVEPVGEAAAAGAEAGAAGAEAGGGLLQAAGPALRGLGLVGSAAGLGQDIAAGNAKNAILDAAAIAASFLPPPFNFIVPVALGGARFLGPESQAVNQAHEHASILKAFGTAFPQRLRGVQALEGLSPAATDTDLLAASDAIRNGLYAGAGISQFISTGGGREKGIRGADTSFYYRPVKIGDFELPLGTVLDAQNLANAVRMQDALAKRGGPLGSPQYGYDQPLVDRTYIPSIAQYSGVDPTLLTGSRIPRTFSTPSGAEEGSVFEPGPQAHRLEAILEPGHTEERLVSLFRELNPNFDQSPFATILRTTPQVPIPAGPPLSRSALPPPPTPDLPEPQGAAQQAQGIPSFQAGGIVPQTGTYRLHEGERVIPVGSAHSLMPAEDLHAYLATDEGGIRWAKKNPDATKYWRLAFTPQEGRAALLEGDAAEIPVVVPRAITKLPGRRLVAAVEAARRAQHQDPVRTLGDFLSPAVSISPPLFDVLAREPDELRRTDEAERPIQGGIRDTIVPLTPGPFYRGPQSMPQPMTPGLRESVGVGI